MMADWRCVLIKRGALSMEMDGHILTLKLPADNLDTPLQVYVSSLVSILDQNKLKSSLAMHLNNGE